MGMGTSDYMDLLGSKTHRARHRSSRSRFPQVGVVLPENVSQVFVVGSLIVGVSL